MSITTFYREKEIKTIKKEQFGAQEIEAMLKHDKPARLFHHHYSTKTARFTILEYTDKGLQGQFDGGLATFYTWQELYEALRKHDLTQWFYI